MFPEADLDMIQKGKSVELINVKQCTFSGFVNVTVDSWMVQRGMRGGTGVYDMSAQNSIR